MNLSRRVLIDGIPRCGTTSFARIMGTHPNLQLIIEPFHPRRYFGRYNQAILSTPSCEMVLAPLWRRFNLIKHIWEPRDGFPFRGNFRLNEKLWCSATAVISASRTNLVKRYISAELSRRLKFWIGTRQEFLDKLKDHKLAALDTDAAQKEIEADYAALRQRAEFIRREGIMSYSLIYEDFFSSSNSPDETKDKLKKINQILVALKLSPIEETHFRENGSRWADASSFKWASEDVYHLFPNIEQFDQKLGCAEFGWALR